MSLRDTIDGARREIEENNGGEAPKLRTKKADEPEDAKAKAEAKAEASRMSYSRKSAASAKPSTQAGASVRTASSKSGSSYGGSSSKSKEQQKEDRKEEKRRRREEEDFRNQGYEIVMRSLPDYKKYDRIWWVLLITGFALAVISLLVTYIFPTDDYSTTVGIASAVSLVLAYAFIIGAFVFDLVKRRPQRKRAETIVSGMTDKKIGDLIKQDRARAMAEDAEREAEKAAKRAAKEAKKSK